MFFYTYDLVFILLFIVTEIIHNLEHIHKTQFISEKNMVSLVRPPDSLIIIQIQSPLFWTRTLNVLKNKAKSLSLCTFKSTFIWNLQAENDTDGEGDRSPTEQRPHSPGIRQIFLFSAVPCLIYILGALEGHKRHSTSENRQAAKM